MNIHEQMRRGICERLEYSVEWCVYFFFFPPLVLFLLLLEAGVVVEDEEEAAGVASSFVEVVEEPFTLV